VNPAKVRFTHRTVAPVAGGFVSGDRPSALSENAIGQRPVLQSVAPFTIISIVKMSTLIAGIITALVPS